MPSEDSGYKTLMLSIEIRSFKRQQKIPNLTQLIQERRNHHKYCEDITDAIQQREVFQV